MNYLFLNQFQLQLKYKRIYMKMKILFLLIKIFLKKLIHILKPEKIKTPLISYIENKIMNNPYRTNFSC